MEGAQFFAFGTQGGNNNNAELPGDLLQPHASGSRTAASSRSSAAGACSGAAAHTASACCRCARGTCPRSTLWRPTSPSIRVQREILRRSRIGVIGTRRAPSSSGTGTTTTRTAPTRCSSSTRTSRSTDYIAKTETAGPQRQTTQLSVAMQLESRSMGHRHRAPVRRQGLQSRGGLPAPARRVSAARMASSSSARGRRTCAASARSRIPLDVDYFADPSAAGRAEPRSAGARSAWTSPAAM